MVSRIALVSAVVIAAISVQPARSGSIYAKARTRTKSLYADPTAREVGDTLTIFISERSVVENDTSRSLSKTSSRKAGMRGTADMKDLLFGQVNGSDAFEFPRIDVEMAYGRRFNGQGQFDTERTITDQITVAVEDVLPNGNLVILGSRYRETAGEKTIVQVSGIVRPDDISYGNIVLSQRVADFRLILSIEGNDKRMTSPGFWGWLLDVLSPF